MLKPPNREVFAGLGMGRGLFVTIDGPDGVGKSTQVSRLVESFRSQGRETIRTREPGGTALGERLREVLLSSVDPDPWTELMIVQAARVQHDREVLRPSLEAGRVVVSDRYLASSYVYQGRMRGLGLSAVDQTLALLDFLSMPDLTIILDRPSPQGSFTFDRADLFETGGLDVWNVIREGFLECADRFGWSVVDAQGSVEQVAEKIWELVGGLES